jgi:hypothetical protein
MLSEWFLKGLRQESHPVLLPFPIPYHDLILSEIHILYRQAHTLQQVYTTTRQQSCHQARGARERIEQALDFLTGEHHEKSPGSFRTSEITNCAQRLLQYLRI